MSDGRIIIDTQIDTDGAEKGVKGLGGKLGSLAKGALVGITAATVAVGGLVKASVEQYSQFEQLTGGVETLFKSSRNKVMEYADNAYKTAGMSANEYMSTITGFSASLLQGLGGDTAKAAEVGNKAVTDMSDNANKMGTAIENIQNAYQGFAKQNYTMLDNLKLGYGGTKTEMERLLADAEKISGVKYDIGNFSDVIEAIHIVQNEIGITGTTAKEASSTIEGSLNMTKSAWNNLLTNMAFDDSDFDMLVGNLVDSVGALGKNLLPRVEIALNGVGELISRLLPPIAEKIPEIIMSLLPKIVEAGTNIISSLITGIQTNLPSITTGAIQIISSLVLGLIQMLPQLLQMGITILVELIKGIAQMLPTLIPIAISAILTLIDTLINNIDLIVDAGIQLLIGLAEGLIVALPILIEKAPILIEKLLTALSSNSPKLLEMGIKLVVQLGIGLIKAIPQLLQAIPTIIMSMVKGFTQFYSNMSKVGSDLISNVKQAMSNKVSEFTDVGKNIVKGVWSGITSMGSWIGSNVSGFFSGLVDKAKKSLGIHSPSRIFRDQVGAMMAKGVGVGFEDESQNIQRDMQNNLSNLTAKMQATVDYETANTTAKVVAKHEYMSNQNNSSDTSDKGNSNQTFIAKLIVDGKEFTQTVVAPNQEVLTEYYEGR